MKIIMTAKAAFLQADKFKFFKCFIISPVMAISAANVNMFAKQVEPGFFVFK
jgi:hypothetical protein